MADQFQPGSRTIAISVSLVIVAALTGYLLGSWQIADDMVISLMLAGILIVPLVLASLHHYLDPISPVFMFAGTWLVMFVLRAVFNLQSGDMTLRGRYDVGEWYFDALLLASFGAVCFYLAYYATLGRNITLQRRAATNCSNPRAFVLAAYLIALPTSVVTVALRSGRIPRLPTAYIYMVPTMLLGCSLILLGIGLFYGRARWTVTGLLLGSGFIVNAVLVANRFMILLGVVSMMTVWFTRSGRKIPFTTVAIGAIGAIFLVIGPVLAWGSTAAKELPPTERLQYAGASIGDSWETFIEGPTNEMLPALALEISTQDSVWKQSPGYVSQQLMGHWIPRVWWEEKRVSVPEYLYSLYFPASYEVSRANVQFSVLGELYFDSGWTGILIGMTTLGAIFGLAWKAFLMKSSNIVAHVAYAPVPFMLMYTLRGDLALISSVALFLFLPVIVGGIFALLANSYSSARTIPRVLTDSGRLVSHA